MREKLPWGGHHAFDVLVARRLQRFYGRIAARRPEATSIVDLGSGPGHMVAAMQATHPEASVIGIDLDPRQIRIAQRHYPEADFRFGASHDIPLPDASVDWITATETFHHWSQPVPSLDEMYRVLRPGGEAWIIEGAGDMTQQELTAWSGIGRWPGFLAFVRWIFRRHGYLPDALADNVVAPVQASPFGGCNVDREDGWFVVRLRR